MTSYGKYISKYLITFMGMILILLSINIIVFGWTFHSVITGDYGKTSPLNMLESVATASNPSGISQEMTQELKANNIWAMFLNLEGKSTWSVGVPDQIPHHYTIQDVARFTRGYLADYPVFVRSKEGGLLMLGYPKDSFTKLTSNYFSIRSIKILPFFLMGILAVDILLVFIAYYLSKRRIIKSTEPIITGIKTLSNGKPIALSVQGELEEVAENVNKTSRLLSKQNQARANWISGVSHDIRTPLSMIMGYADRIAGNHYADHSISEQAGIIRHQSIKIKELVQDLNLVSQLEYEMQPVNKQETHVAKLLRSYVAELLNSNLSDAYVVELTVTPAAEQATLACDERLMSRAINNLVQNSIRHNPTGCNISLHLDSEGHAISIVVKDNGVGLSPKKLHELNEKPHYMNSTDERLDLRHGLGLLLVRQIIAAHGGRMVIESGDGCTVLLDFTK